MQRGQDEDWAVSFLFAQFLFFFYITKILIFENVEIRSKTVIVDFDILKIFEILFYKTFGARKSFSNEFSVLLYKHFENAETTYI